MRSCIENKIKENFKFLQCQIDENNEGRLLAMEFYPD
jgi:hypothetical protein